jgi:16S rRNA (guanine966-N2)-methyltransferase
VRIVGGAFRGRVLLSPEGRVTRPTADRVREALFNILTGGDDLDGITVLDVFAGTGALGFEALSRGASQVTFIENDPAALQVIGGNIKTLGVADRAAVLRLDATKPPKAQKPFDLAMFDAPYRSGLAGVAILALDRMGWLAKDPTITVEVAAAEPFKAPGKDFEITDERKYGAARVVFVRRVDEGG